MFLMAKFGFLGILLISIALFGSCSNNVVQRSSAPAAPAVSSAAPLPGKSYGPYLAGRVAHLRKDFNKASDYYIETLKIDPSNKDLVNRLYLLLASKGRVDEAATYAKKALANGEENNFVYIVIAVNEMKHGKYKNAQNTLGNLDNPIYKEFINPLLNAWSYAGQNQPDKALAELKILDKEPSFRALYHFHAGMINDYFNRNREAQKHYEVIVNEESLEMSFRALQVIANFYIRTNQKDKAVELVNRYKDDKVLTDMLRNLRNNVADAKTSSTARLIDNPNAGAAEALFSIAATLRQGEAGIDLAHMFISMAIYENPRYDLAKVLLADILESREMYDDANEVYDSIPKNSEAYYTVQLKKANNLVQTEDYKAAELLLKSLALDSGNYQLYLDLGDILRLKNEPQEAIKYYRQALKKIDKLQSQHWVLFYALGIAYEQDGEWGKAEQAFTKALELSRNHYLVLNYLGYSWIRQGRNIEPAVQMVVEAYNQAPNDGNINDSLGWALYNTGFYDKAIIYLEKAAETEPSNAVISDHLGDAYWFGNRKNEAGFQWRHALTMKDESGELDRAKVKEKIASGLVNAPALKFNRAEVEKAISKISAPE